MVGGNVRRTEGGVVMRSGLKAALLCCSLMTGGAAWGQASPSDFTYATRYDAAQRVTGTIAPDPDGGGVCGTWRYAIRMTPVVV